MRSDQRQAVSDEQGICAPFWTLARFPELRVALFGKGSGCSRSEDLAKRAGCTHVAFLNQVHGTEIHVVEASTAGTLDGDGLITSTPSLAITIGFADCQNFIVYEPRRKVIGLLHAGWRGLAKGAITSFFGTLKKHFGIDPKETFVGAGPSLCKGCAKFSTPLEELPPHLHCFVTGQTCDLQAAADAELLALGVPWSQIERHPDCTRCQRQRYWTYRGGDREEVQRGFRNFLVGMLHPRCP